MKRPVESDVAYEGAIAGDALAGGRSERSRERVLEFLTRLAGDRTGAQAFLDDSSNRILIYAALASRLDLASDAANEIERLIRSSSKSRPCLVQFFELGHLHDQAPSFRAVGLNSLATAR